MEFITKNETETKSLAKQLFGSLDLPIIVALYGPLGSGKTTFVQGLAASLGVQKRVISPTFILRRDYPLAGGQQLYHLDLYRLGSSQETNSLDLENLFESPDTLIAIEWPEIIEALLPKDTIRLKFEYLDPNTRKITKLSV